MTRASNVVSINRTADFWRQRAQKKRQAMRYTDTVHLLKQAVRTDPDNARCRLELAEAYAEIHCYELSNRTLLALLAQRMEHADAYYILANNYIEMGLYDRALDAMASYIHYAPENGFADDARDTLEWLSEDVNEHALKARCRRMTQRAAELIRRKDARGTRMLTHALRVSRCGDCALAMSAMLSAQGLYTSALRCCEYAAKSLGHSDFSVLAHKAVATAGKGQRALAETLLIRAGRKIETLLEVDFFCQAAQRMHADQAVLVTMTELTGMRPYAAELKHRLAIALYNSGERAKARAVWQAIFQLDESDRVAEYWKDEHEDDPVRLPYQPCLPFQSMRARLERFFENTQDTLSDAALDELKWALSFPMPNIQLNLMNMVFTLGRERGSRLTRELLTYDTLTPTAQRCAVLMLSAWGEKPPFLGVVDRRLTKIEPLNGTNARPKDPDWQFFFRRLCVCLQPDVKPMIVARRALPVWRAMSEGARARALGDDMDAWLCAFQTLLFGGAGLLPPPIPKRRLARATRALNAIIKE